jgi:UDP-N-acetylglucosamine:LPS N-acetylglucosamine transferase
LELTALKRPFLYFPLKQHVEQEADVAVRCERHGAGIRMDFAKTSPELLAETVVSNFDKNVSYASFPTDGAKNAAFLISQVLNEKS